MKNYDAWAVKSFCGKQPWIMPWMVRETRREVLKFFTEFTGEPFRKFRRQGIHKIVKVKICELEERKK